MLRKMVVQNGRVVDAGTDVGQILLYINPNESERRELVDYYKVDEHTLMSSLDPNELSRIEFEPDHIAVIIKEPKRYQSADNFLFQVLSTGIFKFEDKLIIVMSEEIDVFSGKLFSKITTVRDIMLRVLYKAIFHFEDHLKVISLCSDQLEKEVNTAMENRELINMFTLEKSLVYYLNAISSNGRVVERMKANCVKLGFTHDEMDLLDDLAIENAQCYEQAQIYSQVLSGLMDARASIVSNNLNVLMKTLNIVMVALMAPTVWIGVFSMNVPIPFSERPITFWVIVGVSVLIIGAVILIRKFLKW